MAEASRWVVITSAILLTTMSFADEPSWLSNCSIDGHEGSALCGSLEVLENRSLPDGRKIPAYVVVLPAREKQTKPDPIFVLAGGPGQAATRIVSWVPPQLAELNRERDLVFVDQRGTGSSNALPCRTHATDDIRAYTDVPTVDQISICRDELVARADLTKYTTPDFVDDLEDVRKALGYEQINLNAGSYGTRVALWYMKQHPDAIRSAVLNGISPTEFKNPLPSYRGIILGLDALSKACRKNRECRKTYPRFRAQLIEVLDRLERTPVEVDVKNPATGDAAVITLDRRFVVSRLLLLLISTDLASQVPYLIDRAHAGDYGPLAELSLQFGKAIRDQIIWGMQLSVICAEDIPRISERELTRAAKKSILDEERVRNYFSYCSVWPRANLPKGYFDPIESDTPVLMFAGGVDPLTPPDIARGVAKALQNEKLVIVDEASHSIGGPCIAKLIEKFVRSADPSALDASCVRKIRRPSFVIPN